MTTADAYGDEIYQDREPKPYGLIALVLIALLALAAVGYWKLAKPAAGPYGAIAMSDSALTYGGAWGYADPITAYKRAITECNQAGSRDCVVKVSLKDNCAALAVSVEKNASFLVQGRDQVATTGSASGPPMTNAMSLVPTSRRLPSISAKSSDVMPLPRASSSTIWAPSGSRADRRSASSFMRAAVSRCLPTGNSSRLTALMPMLRPSLRARSQKSSTSWPSGVPR
jgi:hypothetical protein